MIAELFADRIRRSQAGALSVLDLIGSVEYLTAAGERRLASELYRVWLHHNGQNPLRYAVLFNYAVILSDEGDAEGAKRILVEATLVKPDFMPAHINLGTLLDKQGLVREAVEQWRQVIDQLPQITADGVSNKSTALKQIGRVLESAHVPDEAENALLRCLELDPRQRDAVQHWIALRQGGCKWPVISPPPGVKRADIMRGVSPLSLATLVDDPLFQLANAFSFYRAEIEEKEKSQAVGGWPAPEAQRGNRLRIGYVSSDLRNHAVGFLSCEVFELHDREAVEVFAYYCGIPGEDAIKTRIKAAVEHWVDINDMTEKQAAERILQDRIDILVDLNGYSKDGRLELFAMRPAPIIVNWLGFPGTMGTPHHNYIIGDDVVLPPENEKFFTERVLRLPCYQPNDRARVVSANKPTRRDAGLPDDAFVFCCFNGSQKLTKFAFARWMRILQAVPNSVLWLLTHSAATDQRLRDAAVANGVAADRIVFAGKMANADHLARYPLADLFLDTAPYGAHTTASDAIFMGVPVLTTPGRAFASRVCGSIVHAAGLPDMICANAAEYEQRAIALGQDPAQMAAIRARLQANRDSCTLFDTPRLTRSLEELYRQMWDEYQRGDLHRPDFTNLDVYREIGLEEDYESFELDNGTDYNQFYRTRLAYKDRLRPIPHDRRLWSAERLTEDALT